MPRFVTLYCYDYATRPKFAAHGSITSAHASVGAAATWPTTGTILSPAEAMRHGAAASPQPLNAAINPIDAASDAIRRATLLPDCLAFTRTPLLVRPAIYPPRAATCESPSVLSLRRHRLDSGSRLLGALQRFTDIAARCERHAHAALDEALGLAEQAQVRARHGERLRDAFECDARFVQPAVDHGRRARRAQGRINGQAENGARVQLELGETLRRERHE